MKPMLAFHYKDNLKHIKYPIYMQPKLDGIRLLYQNNWMQSRSHGKEEAVVLGPNRLRYSTGNSTSTVGPASKSTKLQGYVQLKMGQPLFVSNITYSMPSAPTIHKQPLPNVMQLCGDFFTSSLTWVVFNLWTRSMYQIVKLAIAIIDSGNLPATKAQCIASLTNPTASRRNAATRRTAGSAS
jgi:hypothetical protein